MPDLIKRDRLYVTGVTGDGGRTGEVWGEFEALNEKTPFDKISDDGYELRFFGEKGVAPGKDVLVGLLTAGPVNTGGYATVELPASLYASFDVYVAKGYDSGNDEMRMWLDANAGNYELTITGGTRCVVECYNEKFKGGSAPDSIVEIWLPIKEKK